MSERGEVSDVLVDTNYTAMDGTHRQNVQSIIDALERVGVAIGEWEGSVNAREKSVTYTAKFARKCGVDTAVEWTSQIEQAPAMLADACRKLLAADEAVTLYRVLLGGLIDALSDEIKYEVSQSSSVLNRVDEACRELGGNYVGYIGDWL